MKPVLNAILLGLFLGQSCLAWAQTSIERRGQALELERARQHNLEQEQLPQPTPPRAEPAPLRVDERPLWRLREQGRYQELRREIAHLRAAYPGWEPPETLQQVDERPLWQLREQGRQAELERALQDLRAAFPGWQPPPALTRAPANPRPSAGERARPALEAAVAAGDKSAVLRLAAAHPGLFRCRRVDFIWALGDAWRDQGRDRKLQGLYRYIIERCRNADHRFITLQKAFSELPGPRFAELLAMERGRNGRDAVQQARLDDLDYAYHRQLLPTEHGPAFTATLQALAPEIMQRRDSATALTLGWRLFEQQDYPAAEQWFGRAADWDSGNSDTGYGLALARFKQDKLKQAEAALGRPADARAESLLADIYLARAERAARQGEPDQSNQWLDRAATLGRDGAEQTLLRAWNHHALQQDDAAAEGFRAAYMEQASADAAQGLVLSMGRAGHWEELQTLARELGDPLHSQWQLAQSERLEQRGLHQAAFALAPERNPQLEGLGAPWLSLGLGLRQKKGDSGTSQLEIKQLPMARGEWRRADQQLGLSLARVRLDSGELPAGAAFGGFAEHRPWRAAPLTRLDAGLEPRLWWQREGWTSWRAELGLTPLDGPVSAAPLGRLQRLQQTAGGHWSAELFLQPLRESMLSYVGSVDPSTGQSWGRVRKWGLGLSAYQALNPDWSLSAGLELAAYRGKQVADNQAWGINLGLGRELGLDGFDYFSLGPELSYQAFDRNLSHFTLGHGGYFSPQRRFAAGLAAGFQRRNGRYALGGRLYTGWATQHQAASPCFPLGGAAVPNRGLCADGFTASDDQGFEINGYLSLALRLSDHSRLLLALVGRDGINYQDGAALLGVRIHLDRRPAVLSSDLPQSWLTSLF